MIRPVASSITGYVYNEWDELTAIIGNNGLATKFEYDAAGRLIKTYSEVIDDSANGVTGGFKLVKTNGYHYKDQP
jgi:YD repeat-containing protein